MTIRIADDMRSLTSSRLATARTDTGQWQCQRQTEHSIYGGQAAKCLGIPLSSPYMQENFRICKAYSVTDLRATRGKGETLSFSQKK